MRVLLVKPYFPYPYSKGEYTYNRIWPPLCLANCAALLEKEGHKVSILDAHAQRIRPHTIHDYVKSFDKIFITSSSLDKWQCPNININTFLETVHYIRELNEEVYIMGYHGTVEAERLLELTNAKAIIIGEPEQTVFDICRNNDFSGIKGLAFRNNGKSAISLERNPLDLNTLPLPAYHLLDFRRYFYEILGRNFALFETSRGCNFKCRFCNKIMYDEGVRRKPIELILEEIQTAVEKFNVKTGYFIDLDFLSNKEIVEQLCDFLIDKRYDFRWCCQTRVDLLNMQILKKMKKAGCKLVHLGIESGLQKFLDYLGKNITLNKALDSVKMCQQLGIKTLAFFLFGLSDETEEDRKTSFKFIKRLNTNFVSFHKLISYQGCSLSSLPRNISLDVCKYKIETQNDIDSFIRNVYIKYYLRPCYLLQSAPFLTGNCLRLFWGRIRTAK